MYVWVITESRVPMDPRPGRPRRGAASRRDQEETRRRLPHDYRDIVREFPRRAPCHQACLPNSLQALN